MRFLHNLDRSSNQGQKDATSAQASAARPILAADTRLGGHLVLLRIFHMIRRLTIHCDTQLKTMPRARRRRDA
jgi:hypothetical protein